MSEVMIRGIEIPESCAECRFCVNGFTDDAPMYECACQSYDNVSVLVDDHGKPFDFRPDWCPLVEVTTYDCDNSPITLTYRDLHSILLTYRDLHSILAEQPTIIEAEGNEE